MVFCGRHTLREMVCTFSTCHQIWRNKSTFAYTSRVVSGSCWFRQALAENVSVIAYAKFENVMEIDCNRNIIYDFSV